MSEREQKEAPSRPDFGQKKGPMIHIAESPFWKMAGDHLAQGDLMKADGKQTPPANSGHFGLHEYDQTVLFGRFVIVTSVRPVAPSAPGGAAPAPTAAAARENA